MINIMLVEDDVTFSTILESFLKKNGYSVDPYFSVKSALNALDKSEYDLFLMDYRLGDGNCLEIMDALHEKGLNPPVIVMTGFDDVRTAVKAMRKGVYDYITKPVNPEELLMIVKESLKGSTNGVSDHLRNKSIKVEVGTPLYIEGDSRLANKLQEYIQLVAPTDMSVLIRGESGTGKEYVARAIHRNSKRANMPFVSIDCGTLSKELAASELFGHIKGSFTGALNDKKGQFEEASGGTLFLDEIGNLSYDVQIKLLRALQERVIQPIGANRMIKVDVRVIAATNVELIGNDSVNFREDLYHRINEFEILVPALRDRGADLFVFTNFFINEANVELGKSVTSISDEVKVLFEKYDWPGNIRELKNVIKRMILLTNGFVAEVSALPDYMVYSVKNKDEIQLESGDDLKSQSEAHERKLILEVLEKVKYNKSKAAQLLNIDRKTLYNKLEKYNII
jgi:two-component system response regulator HydG